MACGCCDTLGGPTFDPVGGKTQNYGSTGNVGRHGASNRWGSWPKRGSVAGITARAPYNIGVPKTANTIGGSGHHNTGLDLGVHGHGVGVVPAALGGPHNKRTRMAQVSLGNKGSAGGKVITPLKFCPRCVSTWLLLGAATFLILLVKR